MDKPTPLHEVLRDTLIGPKPTSRKIVDGLSVVVAVCTLLWVLFLLGITAYLVWSLIV